jgi:AcrR family transcriptional regulator
MVQNEEARPRGRPREYDPEVALQQAMDAFWDTGFSGTSLDDLSTRTGMNRPSLYAAFGDKQALYLKTLEAYLAGRRKDVAAALAAGRPLRETLRELYETVLDRFLEGDRGARGCYLVGTAATEAVDNPEVREMLARSLRELDGGFREAFSRAKTRGELGPEADPEALATVASAIVYTLALRARAGQPRAALRKVADSAVQLICSSGGPTRKRRRGR